MSRRCRSVRAGRGSGRRPPAAWHACSHGSLPAVRTHRGGFPSVPSPTRGACPRQRGAFQSSRRELLGRLFDHRTHSLADLLGGRLRTTLGLLQLLLGLAEARAELAVDGRRHGASPCLGIGEQAIHDTLERVEGGRDVTRAVRHVPARRVRPSCRSSSVACRLVCVSSRRRAASDRRRPCSANFSVMPPICMKAVDVTPSMRAIDCSRRSDDEVISSSTRSASFGSDPACR